MTVTSLRDFASRYADDDKRIPTWTLGDRMAKAMNVAGMSVGAMADIFGVDRNTVSRWINDRAKPKPMILMLWADGCGVDQQWLETGVPSTEAVALAEARAEMTQAATPKGGGLDPVRHQGLEPRTRCLKALPGIGVNIPLAVDRGARHLRIVEPVAS
jgi:transcriptional regulator with XRE-family HTH domain